MPSPLRSVKTVWIERKRTIWVPRIFRNLGVNLKGIAISPNVILDRRDLKVSDVEPGGQGTLQLSYIGYGCRFMCCYSPQVEQTLVLGEPFRQDMPKGYAIENVDYLYARRGESYDSPLLAFRFQQWKPIRLLPLWHPLSSSSWPSWLCPLAWSR